MSPYTDRQAVELVGKVPLAFAQDLARKSHGSELRLSEEQINWCHVLVVQHQQEKQEAETKVQERIDDLTHVIELFEKAGEVLQRPRVRLRTEDGINVHIFKSDRPKLREQGFVVTNGNRQMFGLIHLSGLWKPHRSCYGDMEQQVLKVIREFAHDPVTTAISYGKLTGACCFCGLTLTDIRSVTVGYGPICAEKWDLPWGDDPVIQRAMALEEKLRQEVEGLSNGQSANGEEFTED